mmetsp:Transcript_65968/g.148849  ORF Transcript_65968/g.148849 Transcript_65968/m.148849 type:complete len:108 (-) Transcript_65968:176-499(-)
MSLAASAVVVDPLGAIVFEVPREPGREPPLMPLFPGAYLAGRFDVREVRPRMPERPTPHGWTGSEAQAPPSIEPRHDGDSESDSAESAGAEDVIAYGPSGAILKMSL